MVTVSVSSCGENLKSNKKVDGYTYDVHDSLASVGTSDQADFYL